MDWNVTVMDEVDTTNTPFDPVLRDLTDLVTDVVLGLIVVDFRNVVDADSLTLCTPSIIFTLSMVVDIDR